jgi:ketosteroid isomerase-like protein
MLVIPTEAAASAAERRDLQFPRFSRLWNAAKESDVSRIFRTIAVFSFVLALIAQSCAAQSAAASSPEAAIRKVLNSQVDAWNRHDLEAFMAGYWNSPDLTFFSGATETHGWQPTLERYRKKYQAPGAEMGRLEFQDLQLEMLGTKAGFVRGKFRLTLSNGQQPHGLFTLVVREFPEGWRIIHDHSCGE